MAYKNEPGRGNMMKTGRGIPPQFYGPQMTEDGIVDDIVSGAKKVAKKISTAHDAGMKAYYGSTRSATGMGDFGGGGRRGGSYARNPLSYFSGAAKSLVND